MQPKVQKNFRLNPELANKLKRHSYAEGCTETDVVEEAITAYLSKCDRDDMKKAVEIADKADKRRE